MKGAKYKILHEFQSGEIVLGTDYSYDYVKDKGIMLYFYNEAKKDDIISISFKTFLESFSIDFNQEYEDPGDGAIENIKKPIDFSIKYKFKLNIPSISLNDARVNAARLEELNYMVRPIFASESEKTPINKPDSNRILLANLIHNGKYKSIHEINSISLIKSYGIKGSIESFSFNAVTEDGYYEYEDKLFHKTYSIQFSIDVTLREDESIDNKRYLCGYSANGTGEEKDIKSWPFGVL